MRVWQYCATCGRRWAFIARPGWPRFRRAYWRHRRTYAHAPCYRNGMEQL